MSEGSKMRDLGKQMRREAFSIPNLLSYFRLLLIPLFIMLYLREDFTAALITLAASGLSDVLDGRIARKFNMVTDLGKVLDPVADKLTQCAMMFCVAMRYPAMWWLLGIHVVKELIMIVMGCYVLKKTDTVNSAIWVGKLCTGVIYAVMMLHVIDPYLPQAASVAMTVVCAGLILLSLVVYTMRYVKILGGNK
jgi:cardiolipin synthase